MYPKQKKKMKNIYSKRHSNIFTTIQAHCRFADGDVTNTVLAAAGGGLVPQANVGLENNTSAPQHYYYSHFY